MDRKQKTKYIAMALCVALLFQAVNPVGLSALVNDEMQEQGSAVESETAESEKKSSSEESGSAEENSSSDETKSVEESSSVEGSSVEDSLSNESSVSEESSEAVESPSVIEESSTVGESSTEKISEVEETETEKESEILELSADETGEPNVEGFANAILDGLRNKVDIIDNLEQYKVPKDMGQTIYWNILYNNPDLYYIKSRVIIIDGQYVKTVTPYYYDNTNDNEAYQKGKQDALSVVTNDMSNIQKAIVLHDWIVTHVDYDYDSYNNNLLNEAHSAYGVFVNGSAVCQGICSAYKSLLV